MLRGGSIRTLQVLAAVFMKTQDRARTFEQHNLPATTRKEVDPYRNLSVKIIEAKNIPKKDLLSQSDCYVALRLPTASSKTHRTRTVWDSSAPVWNETFHYRIHSHVKNVLELSVLDQDLLSRDDLCINVFYDLDNLSPGEVVRHVFTLDPETRGELHVEFTVEESEEPPGEIQTNGVLVASHLSLLEVQVENSTEVKALTREDESLALQVTGAYEKQQTVFGLPPYPAPMQPLTFHLNLDLEAEISARLTPDSNVKSEDPAEEEEAGHTPDAAAVTLTSLPVGQEVLLSVPVGKDKDIELKLKATDSAEALDLRLGFDLSAMELQSVERRKLRVCQALQRVLHLSQAPHPEEVPVVAVVGSGGGIRAMTSLLGSLLGLQRLDLLDTVTYIAGVSGSTWAMSGLYTDPNWSQHDLQGPIGRTQAAVSKSQLGVLSAKQLQYYCGELKRRAGEGQAVSFLDLWGLIIEYLIHGERDPATLSDQQRAVAEGQNPFPIYTAVNLKEGIAGSASMAEWCEFTPYEVGLPKYGAFIRAEDFGSEFYMGHLIKRHPETRIPYLLGLWSNLFSINLTHGWTSLSGSFPNWIQWLREAVRSKDEGAVAGRPAALDTFFVTPVSAVTQLLEEMLSDRPIIGQSYNFMRGLNLHRDYSQSHGFTAWKGTHLDAFPNQLTPADPQLHLADSGFSINTGTPPLLRPERGVDVLLSFNFTWGDQFKALKLTEQYCADHCLPFPRIDLSSIEGRPLQECYVFIDEGDPRAPIVLHFPLVNHSFRENSAPGLQDFVSRLSLPPSPGPSLPEQDSVAQRLAYFSREAALLGISPLCEEDSFGSPLSSRQPDLRALVTSACSLLQLYHETSAKLGTLENQWKKTSSERDYLKSCQAKLQGQLDYAEHEIAALQARERQLYSQSRSLQSLVKSEKEENVKLRSVVASRAMQHSHEMKRKEQQLGKMKERLSDKKDRRCTIDILNPVGRADGRRATWRNGRTECKKDEEMFRSLIISLERQLKEAVLESLELKGVLEQLRRDMSRVLRDRESSVGVLLEEEEGEGLSREELNQSQAVARDQLTRSVRQQWRNLKRRVEELGGLGAVADRHAPLSAPLGGTDQEKEMAQLQVEIEQSRELVSMQQELLQEGALSLPSSLRDSYFLEERERMREQWEMFQEQKSRFEGERRSFTEAAIRLGHERKRFDEERASLLQQQFFNLSPFQDQRGAPRWNKRAPCSQPSPEQESLRRGVSVPTLHLPAISQTPGSGFKYGLPGKVSTPSTAELYRSLSLIHQPRPDGMMDVGSQTAADTPWRNKRRLNPPPHMDCSF
ncbi:cytosolic phospholipase A2 zeta-like [Acipenser oxyrinchus oxyrinchus]|uniref:Phospholipase A2 n=1 Tax=Acipenser oxyrinchus oxyrinchus TaxID=40147 RepID=A0AAD8D177_ACIOX|nr:cytosolic phospholipase A2 zeta-like [Acipenser oxyrinchus oxyrinchus]